MGCRICVTVWLLVLDGPNRQSPIASAQRTQPTLAGHSAGPRGTNTTPTNANRAIRNAVQRTQGTRTKFCGFRGRSDHQRTLVIRIAAITLASDSAITLARFRPSKLLVQRYGETMHWQPDANTEYPPFRFPSFLTCPTSSVSALSRKEMALDDWPYHWNCPWILSLKTSTASQAFLSRDA